MDMMASLESVGHHVLDFALTGKHLNFARLAHKNTQKGRCDKTKTFRIDKYEIPDVVCV